MKWDWGKSKTLARLSGPGLFNLRLFAWSYLFLFVPQILFDVVAYESSTWLWLPIWTAGHLAAALAGFLILGLGLNQRLSRKPSLLLNLSVAGTLGVIRVCLIGYTSFRLGLAPDFDLGARIVGGIILGVLLFTFLSSILVSNTDYQVALRKLLVTQSQLANSQRAKQKEISTVQRELEIATRAVIEPRLEAIARALKEESVGNTARRAIVKDLRDLLESQIKPLSLRLKSASRGIAGAKSFRRVSRLGLFKIPDRMKPELALNPLLLFLVLAGLIPFALYIFDGYQWVWVGFLIAAINALIFYSAKNILSPKPSVPTVTGLAMLIVLLFFQSMVAFLVLDAVEFPSTDALFVAALIFVSTFFITVGFGLVATYEYNQDTFFKKLNKNNQRLERELALLNQRLWVEKRDWALRVHGGVQASLTAALARLSGFGSPTAEELALIRQHINQARKSLLAPIGKTTDLVSSTKQIKDTWKGLVKININFKEPSAQMVIADKWASVCANEIIKESISNAVKHGKSDSVKIRFEAAEPGFAQIVVEDNGKGLPNQYRPGLGSQILDEIAFPWSLTKKSEGGTILRARIPVSKRQPATKRK